MRGPRLATAALAAVVVAACASASSGSTAAVRFVRAAGGFSAPIYVTAPRSQPNRLYVVEKTGRILVLVNGKRRARPFLDLRTQVSGGSEQGLLSVAFDPGYAGNHRIYVDYTDTKGDTRVVRYTTNGVSVLPKTRKQILFVDQPYGNHNGGQLAFGPDGRLYVGMGDGGAGGDPENRAQNLGTQLGKLLSIAPGNLAAGWKLEAYGLRNPWRFSFDRATGDLAIGDVGQNAWEEIDFVPAGTTDRLNFGWPTFEGDAKYKDAPLTPGGRLVAPVHVYDHEAGRCSVTGGYVYRGKAVPAARERYFFGDFCTGEIWSLRIVDGKATEVTSLPGRIQNLASFGENAAGELYAMTLDGTLYRLRG